MHKKKLVMATLLAFALTVSAVSATVVHAQEEPVEQEETQIPGAENQAEEIGQSKDSNIITENDLTEHHFGSRFDANRTDATNHYLLCEDAGCSEVKEEAHKFVWYTDEPADDITDGTMVEQCSVCSYESGNTKTIPALSASPVFTADTATWNGESDISFNVNTQGLSLEVYYEIKLKGGTVIGAKQISCGDWKGPAGTLKLSASNIAIKDRLSNFGQSWDNVEEIVFGANFIKTDESGNLTHVVEKQVSVKPDFTSQPDVPEKPEEPGKTKILKNDSGVTMVLPEGVSDNLELKVIVSNGTEEKSAVEKVINIEGDKIKTFDLSLLLNGQNYEYNGQFTSTVSLPVPGDWDMSRLALYYFNEDTKEVTPVAFSIDKENGLIVFSTNHFSKYVLVQKAAATEVSTQITASPQTGDSANIGLYTSMFIMSGFVISTLAVLKRREHLIRNK